MCDMRFIVLLLLTLYCIYPVPSFGETVKESNSQVWQVGERRWTEEEEEYYARWVETHITEDFFIRYKIPVDCADVPYAIRWIYSRIAHLPAAATTKDNKLIGHWSTQWGHLPTHSEWHKDLRFRKALLHLLSETTSRTVPFDTYPVRIDAQSITPGTAFFITESHSGIVGSVVLDGSHVHPVQTWESTYPAKVQKLNHRDFFSSRPESTTHSGLVKFRWPIYENGQWRYLPAKQHPFYSEEQYSSSFYAGYADYTDAVARRIDPRDYEPHERVERLLHTIASYLRERIPIVLAGYQRCRRGGCPEGSDLWETYSTPGRDGFITLLMDHLHQFISSNHLDRDLMRKKMEAISLSISEDRSITFYYVYQNYLWLSPHPEDSIEARWGLKKCEVILSRVESTKSAISFIQRTYQDRDPQYADFATRQQQEILQRLREEWERSRCEGRKRLKKVRENEWRVEEMAP
jgi:hypothetical protein